MASPSKGDSSKGKRKSSVELTEESKKNPRLCFEEKASNHESPLCVICLETIENKSFANNCLHEFCFECLLKWSKRKAECPLCNGPFTAIIHNATSDQEYEEYVVETTKSNDISSSDESFTFDYNIDEYSTSDSSSEEEEDDDDEEEDNDEDDYEDDDSDVIPPFCSLM